MSLFCLHLRLRRFYFGPPLSPTCQSAQEGAGKSSLSPRGGKRRAGLSSQNPTETLAPQVHANEGRGINILHISPSVTHTHLHLFLVRIISSLASVLWRCSFRSAVNYNKLLMLRLFFCRFYVLLLLFFFFLSAVETPCFPV